MLPVNHAWQEGSRRDPSETTPKMDWAIPEIASLVEALRASHAMDSSWLQRREPREAAHASLQGGLATVPRTSIEPMVLAVAGVAPQAVRAMQALLRAGQWHDARLVHQHGQAGETDRGAAEGGLRVDGRAVPQQGIHAVGVKRQDCGERGKRAHGQAGVWVGSGSSQGSTVLARRLSVPTAWRHEAA